MRWLASPKVRLALIVNGLYFISLSIPPPRTARPHFFVQARGPLAERRAPVMRPDQAPLAPLPGPNRASAEESGGVLHVSLYRDLTLFKRRGQTLLLSPSFSARSFPPAEPKSVTLNFILYSDSDSETCPGTCPLTIKADAETVWPERSADDPGGHSYTWKRGSVPHSSSKLEDGRVVETLAAESFSAVVPYEKFLDIISAKYVAVGLGPDWVELNAEQLEALRDMQRRLPRQPPPDDSFSN